MTGALAIRIVRRTTAVFGTRTVDMSTVSAARAITSSSIATHTCKVTLAATTRIPGIGVSARAKAGSIDKATCFRLFYFSKTSWPHSPPFAVVAGEQSESGCKFAQLDGTPLCAQAYRRPSLIDSGMHAFPPPASRFGGESKVAMKARSAAAMEIQIEVGVLRYAQHDRALGTL